MSCVKNLVIDGVGVQPVNANKSDRKIVVLDKGFVYTGFVTETETGIIVKNARCIRVWGTTGGLAQLANEGPTSSTKLDAEITLSARFASVVHVIDCKESAKW